MKRIHKRTSVGLTKGLILNYLAEHPHGVRSAELTKHLKVDRKTIRAHMYQLERDEKVVGLCEGDHDSKRKPYAMVWCLPENVHMVHISKPVPRVESKGRPPLPDLAVTQIIKPAGAWRLDHPTALRSVFEMGAA